jgi:glucose-1-phosphate thymidylyltransferase
MFGVIPAAGAARQLQPLPFSKELLPVGVRLEEGEERPRAVSEYVMERLIAAGATRLCLVIGPHKHDLVSYYGSSVGGIPVCYVVQPEPAGLCDAIFRSLPFAREETVAVGLPDTIWFPDDALRALPRDTLAFLLFPVDEPQAFDAVVCDDEDRVIEIQVKYERPGSRWIWGAFQAPARVMRELRALWLERAPRDEYLGTLVNAYLQRGGTAVAVRAGTSYRDVGTVTGFREAWAELHADPTAPPPRSASFGRQRALGEPRSGGQRP